MASSSCSNFCKHEFRKYHLSLDYVSPYDFITFQCGCHRLYVIWRIFWALYHFIWIILTGVYSYQWAGQDPEQQVKWFIYLTDWAYFTLTFSTIFDAACVVFISLKKDDILQDICPIMPLYLKADWVLFNVSNTISVLVSVMYWGLIYTSGDDMTAVNVETHALSSLYVIINLLMSGIPVRFYHFFHPVIFSIIFIVFSVIYQVSGGTNHINKNYIYSVLDWNNTTHTIMVALIVVLVAVPVCHFLMYLVYLLRIYLNRKCCSRHKRKCTIVTPIGKPPNNNGELELKNQNGDIKISIGDEKFEKYEENSSNLYQNSESSDGTFQDDEKDVLNSKTNVSFNQEDEIDVVKETAHESLESVNENNENNENKENICVDEDNNIKQKVSVTS